MLIRELLPADAAGMFAMDGDPEVHKYVGKTPTKSVGDTEKVIANIRQQYLDNGIARWAVTDKATGDFIGWTGFKLMKEKVNGYVDYYDFGYRLARKYWGKGYATESGKAALQHGLETLQLRGIYAMTDVDNAASRRVLEKLGFVCEKIFEYDGVLTWRTESEPTTWYSLPGFGK
jgi:RimJ/RimL family protein N-acetyltransferase